MDVTFIRALSPSLDKRRVNEMAYIIKWITKLTLIGTKFTGTYLQYNNAKNLILKLYDPFSYKIFGKRNGCNLNIYSVVSW